MMRVYYPTTTSRKNVVTNKNQTVRHSTATITTNSNIIAMMLIVLSLVLFILNRQLLLPSTNTNSKNEEGIIISAGHRANHHRNDHTMMINNNHSTYNEMATSSTSNDGSVGYEIMYQSALTTLSCFVTHGCFPRALCESGHQPQKIKRVKKWEEQPFCVQDLLIPLFESKKVVVAPTPLLQKNNATSSSSREEKKKSQDDNNKILLQDKPCLVYSFGIHVSIEWETKVSKLFGCEVHAFDPTVYHNNKHLPDGLTFHKLGLQGEGTDMSTTNGRGYQSTIDPNLLLPLNEIMYRLNHTNRKLDLLMLDCEGCEWGVLKQMACGRDGDSKHVRQLVLELHFQKKLGLASESDVMIAAHALNCLRRDGWMMTSMAGSGCHPGDANYTRGIADILPGPLFLMYASLQRRRDDDEASKSKQPIPSSMTDLLTTMNGHEWYKEFVQRRKRLGFGQQYLKMLSGEQYTRYDENVTVS